MSNTHQHCPHFSFIHPSTDPFISTCFWILKRAYSIPWRDPNTRRTAVYQWPISKLLSQNTATGYHYYDFILFRMYHLQKTRKTDFHVMLPVSFVQTNASTKVWAHHLTSPSNLSSSLTSSFISTESSSLTSAFSSSASSFTSCQGRTRWSSESKGCSGASAVA